MPNQDLAEIALKTTVLGRTGREVTRLGLGGQASLMVPPPDVDPVAIIEKAFRKGITYFDTSNVYGPSQSFYGQTFLKLGLTPGEGNYSPEARERIYLASKTHMRLSRYPQGQAWVSDFSQGEGVRTAADDVRRTLSQVFGDGKGSYPMGAYLDCIQIHNLTWHSEVDAIFAGLDDVSPETPYLGALAGLIDLRDGTNRSGTNPDLEKLVRHIGITGHWSSPALAYAVQRDVNNDLDTLLVAVNPTDLFYFPHQSNAVRVAHAAGLGVIAMKVFTEGTYYGKATEWLRSAHQVYQGVGSQTLSSSALLRYALSAPGINMCIVGIGKISDDPAHCQLSANIAAAQMEPMPAAERGQLEERLGEDFRLRNANSYFQRKSIGLSPPRNVGVEADPQGFSPAIQDPQPGVRISWDSAYAGSHPVERYDILRDGAVIHSVPHRPQWRADRFFFWDKITKESAALPRSYIVRSIDRAGARADSPLLQSPLILDNLKLAAQKLSWRQSQYIIESNVSKSEDLEGRLTGSGKSGGVAFFENQEVASLSILYTIDFVGGSGEHTTYTLYSFEDGSSFQAKGEGKTIASPDGNSAQFEGAFRIIAGGGRFSGVQGKGRYSGKRFAPLGRSAATYLDCEGDFYIPGGPGLGFRDLGASASDDDQA